MNANPTHTTNYYIEQIEKWITTTKDEDGKQLYGNRSHLNNVLVRLALSPALQHQAAERCIEIVLNGIKGESGVANVCDKLGRSIGYVSGYTPQDPPKVSQNGICKMGMDILHWFALEGWLTVKKFNHSGHNMMWYIIPKDHFIDLLIEGDVRSSTPDITEGAIEWEKPILLYNNNPIQLVKRTIQTKLWHNYTIDNIPEVYQSVNRANAQTWRINNHILGLIQTAAEDNPFLPERIEEEQLDETKKELRKLKIRATNYHKYILKTVLGDSDATPARRRAIATKKTIEMKILKGEAGLQMVMSNWDKQISHNHIVRIATESKGKDLNFLYSLDSRGRMYASQSYLNPLERDVAKALLCYKEQNSVDMYDLAIVTANLMGQDKITFDDRIAYVNENMDMIRELGRDPWSYMDTLVDLDLGGKEKWQALAIFNVWFRLHEHIEAGGEVEDFTSSVPVAYDGSCQGLQILSLLGRDEFVGPMVNIAPTESGLPGDAYAYIAQFLPDALDELDDTKMTDTMIAFNNAIKANPKLARKVVKRNVMTKSYSGTAYGMGEQHLTDRVDYGFQEALDLTVKDCFTLGRTIYNLTETRLLRAAELMQWMIDGIELTNDDDALIRWRMPDGLLCFASKDSFRTTVVKGKIGAQKVSLSLRVPTNKKNKHAHRMAIAPNIVHSIDAYILREIIRNMPEEAPISTVHDSFATASCYSSTMVEVARQAYMKIGDREWFEDMFGDAVNKHRHLPDPGELVVEDLLKTDYFIS